MRRTLIDAAAAAGIATVAATGLAFAQQTPENQHMQNGRPAQIDKGQRTTEPGAGQPARKTGQEAQEEHQPPSEKKRGPVGAETQGLPNAQQEKARTGQEDQFQNQERAKARMGQVGQPEKPQTRQTVAPEARQGGQIESGQGQPLTTTAARRGGNAVATGNIKISSATASQLAEALMSTGRSQNISGGVNVGAPIPGNVDLLPLPSAVVGLVPESQGYEYVVVNDEIVIIQPSTRVVAEIIRPVGVAEAAAGPPPVSMNLTDSQRQLLLDSVRDAQLPEAQIAGLTAGETVPQDVQLAPAPSVVVAQVPTIERYRLFVARNDQVVLVDPNTRVVVDVVR
jgi:hypothetical protein